MDHFLHVMGDQNDCYLFPTVQLPHCLQDFLSSVRIQHGGRLIQDDAPRAHGHHACNSHSLLLSSRKLVWGLITVGCHTDFFQAVIHTFPDIICRNSHVFRAKAYVLFHNGSYDLVIRILKYHSCLLAYLPEFGLSGGIDPVHQHRSLCWDQKRIHMLRQCGFSGSVMSQNCHKFSCFNVQVHIIDCTLHVYHIAVIIVSLIVKSQLERLDNSHLFCSP